MSRFTSFFIPICRCFLINRSDGFNIGFTDHDEPVTVGANTFFPHRNALVESISKSFDNDVNTTSATTIFQSDAITFEDVAARKYDDARYTIFAVNWNNPTDNHIIFIGVFGKSSVSYQGETPISVNVEVRSVLSRLRRSHTNVTVRLCPRELGDGLCQVDTDNFSDELEIVGVITGSTFRTNSPQLNNNAYGTVEFLTGKNVGYQGIVVFFNGTTRDITLAQAPPFSLQVGDRLKAVFYCNRSQTACRDIFSNLENHRGFPNLPGNDQLQRTNR